LPPCCGSDSKTPLSKRGSPEDQGPRFAYDGLDRIIHERARLSVLTSLMTHPRGLPFGDLKRLCALTDGNLNRHLQVLEEAKLVSIKKGSEGNRPQTVCRVTSLGRKRYVEYLTVLEQVLLDADRAVGMESPAKRSRGPANA
jgi:DNA-binding MarR family transcriptional regulator